MTVDETKKPLRIPPEYGVYAEEKEIFGLLKQLMEDQLLLIDDKVTSFMRAKQIIEFSLSAICVLYNLLLLLFLVKTEEFRKWLFFPIMLQAFVDLVGPGLANMAFEWKLAPKVELFIEKKQLWDYHIFLLPRHFVLFHNLYGIPQCVFVYLKVTGRQKYFSDLIRRHSDYEA